MMKRFAGKRLFHLMCAAGLLGLSTSAMAAAFQLYEQDGASVGDYHAGRAAQANSASTAFYNPAGLIRIPNQQLVLGEVGVFSNLKYNGTVGVNTINAGAPVGAVAQGGAFSSIPDLFYSAPVSEKFSVGLSVVAPFGLKTDFGRNTNLRYAATTTELSVIDVSPSFAYAITPKFSAGIGYDWQRLGAEFNQDAALGGLTANSYNKAWSSASGYHFGLLYQPMETTRFGLAYNSRVIHHLHGSSKLVGPVANFVTGLPLPLNGGVPQPIVSTEATAQVTLPAYTTFSAFHTINNRWAIMGTAIYTQWNVFKTLSLNDIAAVIVAPQIVFFPPPITALTPVPSTTSSVTLPEHYSNVWNLSIGSEFYATDQVTFRGGLGYDQSPLKNNLRDVRIPDASRVAVALGAHYQAIKALGFDIGWTHLFVPGQSSINPPPLTVGAQTTVTHGNMQTSADIFGAQFTWDIV
jgi:long-chain fatty acid transport protein